jgi:hypothetical protein
MKDRTTDNVQDCDSFEGFITVHIKRFLESFRNVLFMIPMLIKCGNLNHSVDFCQIAAGGSEVLKSGKDKEAGEMTRSCPAFFLQTTALPHLGSPALFVVEESGD